MRKLHSDGKKKLKMSMGLVGQVETKKKDKDKGQRREDPGREDGGASSVCLALSLHCTSSWDTWVLRFI